MGHIYRISCLGNGKIYIGSAVNVKERFRKHKESLRRGDHHNNYLQNAWRKYGELTFDFQVIEEVANNEILLEREQFWLDFTRSYDRSRGFNICEVAGSQLGVKQSEQARIKKSKTYIVTNPEGVEIIVINLNDFCKKNGLYQGNMVCGRHKGWTCRRANVTKEDWYKSMVDKTRNRWRLTSPSGEEFVIRSKDAEDFCKEHGLSIHSMRDVASGKKHSIRGWKAECLNKKKNTLVS
jgi:group I intron endonuclease